MPRRPCRFSQRDLTRAIRAVRAAGAEIARAEVDAAGKIVIVIGKAPDELGAQQSDWDRKLNEQEQA